MKAFILAAGYGTRLRPITDKTAKCLVPISGQPLLAWWFKLLKDHQIKDVLINTHYLPDQVETFVSQYNEENDFHAVISYEPQLLGSGGTVLSNRSFVEGEDDFLICYADNLTDINLHRIQEFHRNHGGILTMALFHSAKPEQCGIVKLDENQCIVEFEEKPENPKSNLANAGIYIANTNIFNFFPAKEMIDFGQDVLPSLRGKMYGYEMKEYLIDIGTLENYEKAQGEWKYDYYKDTF